MQDVPDKTERVTVIAHAELCHKHGNQQMFFFCQKCKVEICRDCTVLDHKETAGHAIIDIGAAVAAYRHTLENQLITSHTSRTQIQQAIQQIESNMNKNNSDKESAIEDLERFIQTVQHQLEQCQEEATGAILQHHAMQHGKLLGKYRQMQKAKKLLEKHITQSEEIVKTGKIKQITCFTEKLKQTTEMTKLNFNSFNQIRNCFSSTLRIEPNSLKGRLCNIGKACYQSLLPTSVVFEIGDITAGLKSVITVELFNDTGNKVPFASSFLTVQITDPQQEELPIILNTAHPECRVVFTPQQSGKHGVTILYLGQKLNSKQTDINVNSNNPILKFGQSGNGNGSFKFPWGIAMDNDGVLYVADCGNRLIQKFSENGEYISQFPVNGHCKDNTTLDMALDLNNGLLFCTGITLKKNTFIAENTMLVFNLEGELQHSYTLSNSSWLVYVAITRQGDIVMSDIMKKCLCKVDKKGTFLSCMGDLKHPSYITTYDDGGIIVADIEDDSIYIFNPDGSVRNSFGSSGAGHGQLKGPFGVATDGENILVAEGGNNRIQVFRCDGTFASMIESTDDPLLNPRGLAVTRDGHVYVADTSNNCVKKYKYRDMVP